MKKCLFKNLFQKTKLRILKSYLSVNYTPKRFELKDERCLCLAPHQDDETIGMGGTLAKYPKNFDVICLTNGAKGLKNLGHDEAVATRAKEFEAAMKVSKVNAYRILDIEDRALIDNFEKFSALDINPYDYIFVPNIIDQHKDHKAAVVLLARLLEKASYKKDLKIVLYEVWSPLALANISVAIPEQIEIKRKMLEAYPSQCAQRSYCDAALALSKYRGLAKEQDYAEAFWSMSAAEFVELVKELYPLLKD